MPYSSKLLLTVNAKLLNLHRLAEDYKLFRLTAYDESSEEQALVKVEELLSNTQINLGE
jgi:hypothetical protein